MGAHICAWCGDGDPCKCKPGEGRHNTVKMENCRDPGPSIIERIKQAETNEPGPMDTPCGSCGLLKCDCVYKEGWFGYLKDGDMDKATLAAQMEDLGNSYRRMAKCVVICDAADIDLPKWCKEDLLKWARKEVGDKERYMASA